MASPTFQQRLDLLHVEVAEQHVGSLHVRPALQLNGQREHPLKMSLCALRVAETRVHMGSHADTLMRSPQQPAWASNYLQGLQTHSQLAMSRHLVTFVSRLLG